MRQYLQPVLVTMGLLCLAGGWQAGSAQEKAQSVRTLKVKLNYTGTGKVDEKHKIFLFLFDTPDFRERGDMPVAVGTAAAKDATASFSNVAKSPVYLIAVYDPSGEYAGMSVPPSGSSLALYGDGTGKMAPIAIEEGKTAQVDLPFDDSIKMP